MRHSLLLPGLLVPFVIPPAPAAGGPLPRAGTLLSQDPDSPADALRTRQDADRPATADRILRTAAEASRRLRCDLARIGRRLETDLRHCHSEFTAYLRSPKGLAAFHRRRDGIFEALRALEEAERTEEKTLAEASLALGRLRDPAAVGRLISASRRRLARPHALAVVGGLRASATPEALARLAEIAAAAGTDLAVRVAAAEALGTKPAADAVPRLLGAFPGAPAPVQWAIVRALDRLDDPAAVPFLVAVMPKAVGRTRDTIEEALCRLCGRPRTGDANAWATWWASAQPGFAATRPERDAREVLAFGRETVPTFLGLPVTGRAVVFCVDLSTSMEEPVPDPAPRAATGGGGSRADHVREELARALRALPRGARFNVILFAWHLRMQAPGRLLPATPRNVDATLRQARSTQLRHGTSLGEALDRALGLGRDAGGAVDPRHAPDAIYLLSDGAPTTGSPLSGRAIRRRVRELNAVTRTPVHVVGTAPDARGEALLRALADENGGRYVPLVR